MRLAIALGICAVVAGCATTPPPEPPVPAPAPPPAVVVPACPVCVDRNDEIVRLREDLARREAELRELRASQREQARVVQESTREATRTKARARRLATLADAASYLAEVEVALESARALPALSHSALLDLAQGFVDAAAAPFAEGNYASAMDRAGQAEQLVAAATQGVPAGKRAAQPGQVPLQGDVPVATIRQSRLRAAPQAQARVVATLPKDTALVARASKGTWMRVATVDGKSGWVEQRELAAR